MDKLTNKQKELTLKQEKIQKVLTLISEGQSVRCACKAVEIPVMTFKDNADSVQYARAREAQADTHFDEMLEPEDQCKDGNLDPQVLRAVIDSRKWRLARMRPKVYGDKIDVELSGKDGGAIQVMDLTAMTDEELQAIIRGNNNAGSE